MRKGFQLSVIVAAFMLVSMLPSPASGQTPAVLDLRDARVVRQRSESLVEATPGVSQDPGIIAYVRRSTNDIHLMSPDGTDHGVLWADPRPTFLWSPPDLAWRPDGRELAFSSQHEWQCSVYDGDVYSIRADGTGYRRITNAPACAELAGLPKGSVKLQVMDLFGTSFVYVAGAPGLTRAQTGTMTIGNVADFGPGVLQPAVGIAVLDRVAGGPPYADVLPGQTVQGGSLYIDDTSSIRGWGAGEVSWKADGSALAYGMRSCSRISQIPVIPPYGSIGVNLPVVEHAKPSLVAWGPTTATINQYLYISGYDILNENVGGIYLNTVSDTSGGTKLMPFTSYADTMSDIEWLPDGSGFLFTAKYWDDGVFRFVSNVDGTDFAASYRTMGEAVAYARARRHACRHSPRLPP